MLLAFDTSERNATVGVYQNGQPLAELDSATWLDQFDANEKIGSSTALVSLIQDTMQTAPVTADQISGIAFSNGPGTFTGIRVGLVAARMLAYAWKKPLIVVNSLEVSAEKLRGERNLKPGTTIWSAINAQRRQVFAASFIVGADKSLKSIREMSLLKEPEFVAALNVGDQVTGNGAKIFSASIEAKTGVELPVKSVASCDANGIARLAKICFDQNDFANIFDIEPIYFRPSAAEEVRIENALKLGDSEK